MELSLGIIGSPTEFVNYAQTFFRPDYLSTHQESIRSLFQEPITEEQAREIFVYFLFNN